MTHRTQRRHREQERDMLSQGRPPWEREPTVFAPRDAYHPYRAAVKRSTEVDDRKWQDGIANMRPGP